jgi:hypothetical protein
MGHCNPHRHEYVCPLCYRYDNSDHAKFAMSSIHRDFTNPVPHSVSLAQELRGSLRIILWHDMVEDRGGMDAWGLLNNA